MTQLIFAVADALTQEQILKFIDEASQKDFKWWFTAVFTILILSGTYIFRQQQQQLRDEREASSTRSRELLNYIKEDHVNTIIALNEQTKLSEKIHHLLERFEEKLMK